MIDASIPLQGRPVEPPDTQEIYGRMLSLKHMQAQQQQQQALAPLVYQQQKAAATAAQIQAQQMQQDQKDEEIGGRAYNEAKGDLKQYPALAAKYGMSQRGLAKLNQNMLAHQAAATKQQSADLDVEAKRLKNQEATHGQLSDRYNGLLNLTDEEMERRWPDAVSQMFKDGLHTPQEHAAMLKTYGEFPGRATVEHLRNQNTSVAQATKNAQLAASQSTNAKNQQAIDEKKKQDVIGQLRGATNLDQWNKILADNGRGMNDFGPPPFDTQTGEGATERTPNPGALKRLNRMGMTPTQAEAADAAELRAKELKQREDQAEAHRKTMEGFAANRDKRETGLQHKESISHLADQAIAESLANGGTTLDHVLANVEDTNNYQGHPIGASRGEVVAEIRKRKDAKLNTGGKENTAEAAALKTQMLKDAGIVDADLTGGGRGSPIVTPTTKTPAKKETKAAPAAAATPTATATPQRMKNAAGHVIEYDPKLNKWVDAQTRKPVQ